MSLLNDLIYMISGGTDPSKPKVDDGPTQSLQKIVALLRAQIQFALPPGTGGVTVKSTSLANEFTISSAPGHLISLVGYNATGGDIWMMEFDTTTPPINGMAPMVQIYVPTKSQFSDDIPLTGIPFLNGIFVAASTTPNYLTLAPALSCTWRAVIY